MKLPLVSIVIPVYNQEKFLKEALESVSEQTYRHLEILLVDDGSTDSSRVIASNHPDPRLQIIHQTNQGPAAARNRGIQEAKGELIALLDGDDRMDSHRIEEQLKSMHENPKIDIVYTALGLMDQEGRPLGTLLSESYAPENFLPALFFRNIIPGPSTILAKSNVLRSHPYNEAYIHAEDYELMLRLAHHYHFHYIDQPLTFYRRHGSNLSNSLPSHREAEKKALSQYSTQHIRSVVEKSSYDPQSKKLLMGKILFNREEYTQAIQQFKNLEDSANAQFYIGNCHAKREEWLDAMQAYQQSLKLDPTNAACHNNLGILFARNQNGTQAAFHFQTALDLKDGYLDAQFNMSHIGQVDQLRWTWRELRKSLLPYSRL